MQSHFDQSSIESVVDEYIQAKPLVLGFFHHEEDKGSIMSMFPIVNEGYSRSRISFSAPFAIEADRMNLEESPRMTVNRRRIVFLLECLWPHTGTFYEQSRTKDCDLLDRNLIHFLLQNPPGQDLKTKIAN